MLPDSPKFPELEGELPEPMARSLHFLGDSGNVLLVMYLDHGVMWVIHNQSLAANLPNYQQCMEFINLWDQLVHSTTLV